VYDEIDDNPYNLLCIYKLLLLYHIITHNILGKINKSNCY